MIDLHMHTLLSDGVLIPSELVARAERNGIEAVAITDHADHSNIDMVIEAACRVSRVLTEHTDVFVIGGVELTYVPNSLIPEMVSYARERGAEIVVVHGESPVEPVPPGTNRAAIEAGCDVLAHPGKITREDARLAAERGVLLEITARSGHNKTNGHVLKTALEAGAKVVLNTDFHMPEDILTKERRERILDGLDCNEALRDIIDRNSGEILERIKERRLAA